MGDHFVSRSHRRGALSDDPEAIERRKWYERTQEKILKDRLKHEFDLPATHEEEDSKDIPDGDTTHSNSAAKTSLNVTPVWKSDALELADEALAMANKEIDITIANGNDYIEESYTRPPNFHAERWIMPFRIAARNKNLSNHKEKKLDATKILTKIVLFPGIGENALWFKDWVKYFELGEAAEYDLLGVTLPGHLNRIKEPLSKSAIFLAGAVVDALSKLCYIPSTPDDEEGKERNERIRLCFFGHGAGAIIAFEAGRLLRRKGYEGILTHFFVSGMRSLNILNEYNENKRSRKLAFGSTAEIIERLELLGGIPTEMIKVRNDMVTSFIPVVRNDIFIMEKYIYRLREGEPNPPLSCMIITLGADDDYSCTSEHLQQWKSFTSNKTAHFTFYKGGHSYLKIPSNLKQILEGMNKILTGEPINLKDTTKIFGLRGIEESFI